MARILHLWPLSAPLATWNGHSRSKNGNSSSVWMCAIPFQLCSKLCYPFRVTTGAYGQNTAFMAILGLFQPPWPPGTAIPGPEIGSSSSAWMCPIPFQPCSKLCHPFRVATAAYGQNTAFMAICSTFWSKNGSKWLEQEAHALDLGPG